MKHSWLWWVNTFLWRLGIVLVRRERKGDGKIVGYHWDKTKNWMKE